MDLISTLRYAAKRKKEKEEAKKGKASGESEGADPASEVEGVPLEDDGGSGPEKRTPGSES